MKTFRELIQEPNQDSMFKRFVKNNSPAGTIVNAIVNGNMYTVQWKMVELSDHNNLKKVEDWINKNVDVEDIELEFDNTSGSATLFFVADNLPDSIQSKTV